MFRADKTRHGNAALRSAASVEITQTPMDFAQEQGQHQSARPKEQSGDDFAANRRTKEHEQQVRDN